MKRLEIKLNVGVVAPYCDIINECAGMLKTQLAVGMGHSSAHVEADDKEMAAMWRDALLRAQNAQVRNFIALFDGHFFETGELVFDEKNSPSMMRACSALRLILRASFLKNVSESVLEQGISDLEIFSAKQRCAYLAYLFLSSLQELLIEHFGESILNGGEAGEAVDN